MRCLRSPWSVFLVLPLLFTACRDKEVTSYRIPKEKEPEAAAAAAHAHAAAGVSTPATAGSGTAPAGSAAAESDLAKKPVPTSGGAGLTWTAPPHWEAKPASAMRKATFVMTGGDGATAELAVTAFPGDVGGEVANVNRWRTQLQLAPLPEAQVGSAITRLDAGELKIAFVELVNPAAATPTRVLGAWVPHQGSTWFFKLSGPDTLVTREKAAFIQFLNTLKPAAK